MSSPYSDAEEARTRITTDHEVLRSLCRALVEVAAAATRHEAQRPVVRELLAQLCSEIEDHLAYEEQVLVPILRDADAWGPVRVEELSKEHADQRAVLLVLLDDARDGGREIPALADELVEFAQRFERDIAEEEGRLLTAEALGERMIVVDQTDG